MNKQQLASKIWASANKMRSKIEASEYKDYILGFIFYKFLSEKQEKFLFEDGWSKDDIMELNEDDHETKEYVQKNNGYFISYENLFSTWVAKKGDFDIGDVTDALSAFDRLIHPDYYKVFKDIFKTLQTGLDKLGDTSGARTKAIRGLIDLIKDIPMDAKQDYDVLGFIYEYLISNFAANAGKKAGEFYTPHEVSLLMSEIVAHHLQDRNEIEIYDPTSGSGSLLINIGKCISKKMKNPNNIKYYAQELKEATYNLTRMNLVMRGILPSNIITRCGDTLDKDWPFFDENNSYRALYVDAVISNPPYSQPWDPESHRGDIRYDRFGYAPKSKADYAFLLHDLYHVNTNGIMAIVLPHGVLFRGGEEETIRKQLIENDHIDTIIGLPSNIFFGTGIPTIVMVLKQKRTDSDVLFIDASKHYSKQGKNNVLQASDIKRILDAFIERKNDTKFDKFSRLVTKQEIRDNGYNLNIPRYIDSGLKSDSYDLYATVFGGIPNQEIDELKQYFNIFPTLINDLFIFSSDKPYAVLNTEDISRTISQNYEVKSFITSFQSSFNDFENYMKLRLTSDLLNKNINEEKHNIAEYIFCKLHAYPILDKYAAFQILDDAFKTISQDLEIIQTEGKSALTKVDPNIVIRKKNGNDEEVQDGYIGRLLPFELVQREMLLDKMNELILLKSELENISAKYEEIFESLSEDERSQNYVNEEGDAFVLKEVSNFVKPLLKTRNRFEVGSIEYKLLEVNGFLEREKDVKRMIKNETKALEELTKSIITRLDEKKAIALLEKKWFVPIIDGILQIPDKLIKDLTSKLNILVSKYNVTALCIEAQIDTAENQLADMIDNLNGDEFDLKGLKQLRKIFKGETND